MAQKPSALWRIVFSAGVLLACCRGPSGLARAQDDSDDCADVKVVGIDQDSGFPDSTTVYSNPMADDNVRGEYISEGGDFFIWYCPTNPTEYTSETPDAGVDDCTGIWLISSYPVGESFDDLVWYEYIDNPQCQTSPAELDSASWDKMERASSTASVTESTANDVFVDCFADEGGDNGGLSNKTVVVLLIVIGVGFAVFMCLGALACCIKGGRSNEQAVMPPGELTGGSVIGSKAGIEMKPGLHAHPEVQGAQHPRPESDYAPSYSSQIPTGSRSGPSVRSIGYQ